MIDAHFLQMTPTCVQCHLERGAAELRGQATPDVEARRLPVRTVDHPMFHPSPWLGSLSR